MKENRILLTEETFTNLCKLGHLEHRGVIYGITEIHITKVDIGKLATGKIITKEINDEIFKVALQDIGFELIKEIIRRSPLYSQIYYEI